MSIRTDGLASLGADAPATEELLRHNENRLDQADLDLSGVPLADESFVATWRDMLLKPKRRVASPLLAKHLTKLRLAIQSAISETTDYIATTRRERFWMEEFQRIKDQKELHEDCFIILSCRPNNVQPSTLV